VPRSKGGETQATNLVACCLSCNSHKSSHPVFEWFKEQHWYCPLRENRLRDWIAGRAHNYFPNESQEKVEWVPPDPPQSSQFPERY
jgi:hypothetical protein